MSTTLLPHSPPPHHPSLALHKNTHTYIHTRTYNNTSVSPQCGPQHYITVFVRTELAACVQVIHCSSAHTRGGSQWRSSALYNSFRPHKDFPLFPFGGCLHRFFPFLLSFFPLHPHKLYFITSQNSNSTFSCCTVRLASQLMCLFLFVAQDLFGVCFCFVLFFRLKDVVSFFSFLFLHSGLSSLFCYVTERTEAITQCALCPTKRLVQQVAV